MFDEDDFDVSAPDAPMELDCPSCGRHHVFDPAAARQLRRRWLFRCAFCARWRRGSNVAAYALTGHGSPLRGICADCEPMLSALGDAGDVYPD